MWGVIMATLEIKNLHVSVADKEILKGIDLTIKENEENYKWINVRRK